MSSFKAETDRFCREWVPGASPFSKECLSALDMNGDGRVSEHDHHLLVEMGYFEGNRSAFFQGMVRHQSLHGLAVEKPKNNGRFVSWNTLTKNLTANQREMAGWIASAASSDHQSGISARSAKLILDPNEDNQIDYQDALDFYLRFGPSGEEAIEYSDAFFGLATYLNCRLKLGLTINPRARPENEDLEWRMSFADDARLCYSSDQLSQLLTGISEEDLTGLRPDCANTQVTSRLQRRFALHDSEIQKSIALLLEVDAPDDYDDAVAHQNHVRSVRRVLSEVINQWKQVNSDGMKKHAEVQKIIKSKNLPTMTTQLLEARSQKFKDLYSQDSKELFKILDRFESNLKLYDPLLRVDKVSGWLANIKTNSTVVHYYVDHESLQDTDKNCLEAFRKKIEDRYPHCLTEVSQIAAEQDDEQTVPMFAINLICPTSLARANWKAQDTRGRPAIELEIQGKRYWLNPDCIKR